MLSSANQLSPPPLSSATNKAAPVYWTQNKSNFQLKEQKKTERAAEILIKVLLIGTRLSASEQRPSIPSWLFFSFFNLFIIKKKKTGSVLKLWFSAHLEGDVVKLSAVAQGRSARINQPGGRSGGGGQTSSRPPAVSAAARRRLGALGARSARFHHLLPGHGSDNQFGSETRGVCVPAPPTLFFSGVVSAWGDGSFSRASKSWLCVKISEILIWENGWKARQLLSRRCSSMSLRSGSQCKQLTTTPATTPPPAYCDVGRARRHGGVRALTAQIHPKNGNRASWQTLDVKYHTKGRKIISESTENKSRCCNFFF